MADEKNFMMQFDGPLPAGLENLPNLEVELTADVAKALAEAAGVDTGGGGGGGGGDIPEVGETPTLIRLLTGESSPIDVFYWDSYIGFMSNTIATITPGDTYVFPAMVVSGVDVGFDVYDDDTAEIYDGDIAGFLAVANAEDTSDMVYIGPFDDFQFSDGAISFTVPDIDTSTAGVDYTVPCVVFDHPTNITFEWDKSLVSPDVADVGYIFDHTAGESIVPGAGGFPKYAAPGDVLEVCEESLEFDFDKVWYQIGDNEPVEVPYVLDSGHRFTMPDASIKVIIRIKLSGSSPK